MSLIQNILVNTVALFLSSVVAIKERRVVAQILAVNCRTHEKCDSGASRVLGNKCRDAYSDEQFRKQSSVLFGENYKVGVNI